MTGQDNFLHALGWAILNNLWQMALLWVIYQLICMVCKSAKPAAKGLLATLLLMTGFALFLYTLLSPSQQTIRSDWVNTTFSPRKVDNISNVVRKALPVTSVLYLLLLIFPLYRFVCNYCYVQKIRNNGISKAAPRWRLFIQEMSARMRISKPVHIWMSEWVTSPVTVGFLKPIILFPLAAITKLTPQQTEAVLLHELYHIKRHDYLLNFICHISITILYFNPFANAFIKIIEEEREKCCDEWVLQFRYNSFEYASALLILEKINHEQRLFMLSLSGNGKGVYRRIQKILGVQPIRKNTILRIVPVLAILVCMLAIHALLNFNPEKYGMSVMTNSSTVSAFSLVLEKPTMKNIKPEKTETGNTKRKKKPSSHIMYSDAPMRSDEWQAAVMPVNYESEEPAQQLESESEKMIQETISSSKKILENELWKNYEKEIDDAFTMEEKEVQQSRLKNEINKLDWKKWEELLRHSFNEINWEKINHQLTLAKHQLKTDSLTRVYNEMAVTIEIIQNKLKASGLNGIPDSDITMKALTEKLREIKQELGKLKLARPKKVVHL